MTIEQKLLDRIGNPNGANVTRYKAGDSFKLIVAVKPGTKLTLGDFPASFDGHSVIYTRNISPA